MSWSRRHRCSRGRGCGVCGDAGENRRKRDDEHSALRRDEGIREHADMTAAELAAWTEHGRKLIRALPPVDEDAERAVSAALNRATSGYTKRKLGSR